MVSVKLVEVTKRFGDFVAVDHISFHVREGEFFTLLGPSGCGKTTTLRLIAGFYKPDEGEIYFDNKLVNDLPPWKRNIGMVFQNYALWPHMNVWDNIAYGLKVRKIPRREIEKRVKEAIRLVGLEGLEKRKPSQLSGGQQQRVALARALVIEPQVLLLDEPLSNLDAKVRAQLRVEIRKLQKKLKITTIYVTHDQEEALSISDRVAVMSHGRILQIGTPREVYENPSSRFIADFIGMSNFIEGTVKELHPPMALIEAKGVLIEVLT
ncbi:MAG: ABC transporter ATP-binding protein, partial [Thermoprotei archaeon]